MFNSYTLMFPNIGELLKIFVKLRFEPPLQHLRAGCQRERNRPVSFNPNLRLDRANLPVAVIRHSCQGSATDLHENSGPSIILVFYRSPSRCA